MSTQKHKSYRKVLQVTMDELDFLKIKCEVLKIAEQVQETVESNTAKSTSLDFLYARLEKLKQTILADSQALKVTID